MIRKVLTGIAACALMTGAAFADTYTTTDANGNVVVVHQPDPGKHALRGGVAGAGAGALIGCLVTIPIGCAPGAAIGAAVGGGTGAVAGAASTPPPHVYYRDGRRHYDPDD
ncbi:MAG TPA: hypothetical protein VGF50_11580 [Caulobacteraceae bacterium]|jgi:hypothetical protein